jgi:hypothetical protein
MREQEVRELYEAYMQVHTSQEVVEEVEELDEGRRTSLQALSRESEQRKADRERGRRETESETHSRLAMGKFRPGASQEERAEGGRQVLKDRGKVPKKGGKDMFEHILDHLVSEGYADTNEAALKIMANMSEEWRQSIVEGGLPNFGISPSSTTGTAQGDFELGGGITKMKRDNMNRDQVIKQGRKNIDNQSGYTWGHQGPGTPQSNQRKDMYKKQGVTFPEDK